MRRTPTPRNHLLGLVPSRSNRLPHFWSNVLSKFFGINQIRTALQPLKSPRQRFNSVRPPCFHRVLLTPLPRKMAGMTHAAPSSLDYRDGSHERLEEGFASNWRVWSMANLKPGFPQMSQSIDGLKLSPAAPVQRGGRLPRGEAASG